MRNRITIIALAVAIGATGALFLVRSRANPGAGGSATAAAASKESVDADGHAQESGKPKLEIAGLRTVRVDPTEVASSLALTGEVQADANLTARVGSPVSGRLVSLRAKVGDTVRPGQTLAVVASRDAAEAHAALVRARAEEQAAVTKLSSIRDLAQAGALSSKPLEEADREHGSALAAVKQAEAALSAARAARETAAAEVERTKRLAAEKAFQARPVEDARRSVAMAQAAVETAGAILKARQAALDRSKRLLEAGLAARREVENVEAEFGEAQAKATEARTVREVSGQTLAREEKIAGQDLYSTGELRQAQATLRQAEREVEREAAEVERTRGHLRVAEAALAREQKISRRNLLARKEVQEAEAALLVARAQVKAAQIGLAALRASGGSSFGSATSIAIVAPVRGVVVERTATPGQAVEASTDLFTIINTERVWVWANAHQKDIPKVRLGQIAEIRINSFPDQSFTGHVTYVSQELDPKSRTARIRCEVVNRDGALRPGMFASVNLRTSRRREALLLPKEAVLDDAGKKVVFTTCTECPEDKAPGSKGCGQYDKVEVQTGPLHGNQVEITQGLAAGADVVVSGQYQLKTALGSGQLEAGCSGH